MVMPLPPPSVCSEKLVLDVVAERVHGKNAKFFAGIASEWKLRVKAYLDQEGSPKTISRWPEIEHKKGSFLNLYSHPSAGSVQEGILLALRNHDLRLCPACGEAGTPSTPDHYLPKQKYPHFSITPHNLFPMCDICQRRKGEKTGDKANPRFFVHPYFHVFVAKQVMKLRIDPPFDTPSFNLDVVEDLTLEERSLITRHVQELDIPQRYVRFFRGEHRRALQLAKRMRDSEQDVRETFETFRFGVESPSRNSCEHVFYDSLLSNDAMMNYLHRGELPGYV